MKPLILGLSLLLLANGAVMAQAQQTDRRCARHTDKDSLDRCSCTAQAGGKVVSVDAKGFNRWQLPQDKASAFVACMKSKGHRA